MLVQELTDNTGAIGFLCGNCRGLWYDKTIAEQCCAPPRCIQCRNALPNGVIYCLECEDRERMLQEADVFRLAKKVWYFDYEGMLYWVPPGRDGLFFRTKTELEDYCLENRLPIPRWTWASQAVGFLLDAERVLGGVADAQNAPVRAQLSDEEVGKLQDILDEWAMALPPRSLDVDFETAVVLETAFMAEFEPPKPSTEVSTEAPSEDEDPEADTEEPSSDDIGGDDDTDEEEDEDRAFIESEFGNLSGNPYATSGSDDSDDV